MHYFVDIAFAKSRMILVLLFAIFLFGIISYKSISKESFPDVSIPYIFITVEYRGISPEDSERLLIKPFEKELRSITGIKEMRARAYEGGARIVLEFEAGFDVNKALADVRDKTDRVKPDLPDEAEEPSVDELNSSMFPIMVITLSGDIPERTLLQIADDLKDSIESIPSVLEVDIGGDREEQAEIIIDPSVIDGYRLSMSGVNSFFAQSNSLVAAGALNTDEGRFQIKVPGLLETVDDIVNLPIKAEGDSVIRLKDIASGRFNYEDSEGYARVNSKKAITLEVSKRSGENLIDTVDEVKALLQAEKQFWPAGLKVEITQEQSKKVKDSINDLFNNIIAAVLLVMIVVFSALGVRNGVLVGVSIPGAFFLTLIILYLSGFTINMVVLFGLIMSVGMLVDSAIVLTEYSDRRMQDGDDKFTAYMTAAKRMSWPILSSTLTTVVAFLPLIFWPGIVGQFMRFLPITIVLTLMSSFVMAIFFVPVLGSIIGKKPEEDLKTQKMVELSERGNPLELTGITGLYTKLLAFALKHSGKVILLSYSAMVMTFVLYGLFGSGITFFPDQEPETVAINIAARGNLSIEEKDKLVKEVENVIKGTEGIKSIYARSGHASYGTAEDVIGVVNVELKDWDERPRAVFIMEELRKRVAKIAGAKIEVRPDKKGPSRGKPIKLQVSARKHSQLKPALEHIREGMRELGGFVDIQDDLPLPGIQWEVQIDRAEAMRFGTSLVRVGEIVQLLTRGLKISSYRPETSDDEVDIMLRFDKDNRSLNRLDQLNLTIGDNVVPITNFIKVVPKPMVSTFFRTDSKRTNRIEADVARGLLANTKLEEIKNWLKIHPFEPGVTFTVKGDDRDRRQAQSFLVKAFIVAVILIALVLVAQFNSISDTVLTLSAIILSTTGVFLGFLITRQPFGVVMGGLGIISLAGIIVNNNILLIDTYNELKKRTEDQFLALLRTGSQRLRPVFLTTFTSMLGMLPMALTINIDFFGRKVEYGNPASDWWVQLSSTTIFGLTFATVLTLIVTPCSLYTVYKISRWFKTRFA